MEPSQKAGLIIKAFEEDHDVNMFVAVVDSLNDVRPIIDGLEAIFRERSPQSSVQRLTVNEYILHPWKQAVVFTDDTDTLKDIQAYFINLTDSIVHDIQETDALATDTLLGILSAGEMGEDILGNSFIVDADEFNIDVLAEAASKLSKMLDNNLVEIKISIERDCPITSSFNQLPVTTLENNMYEFKLGDASLRFWNGIRVEYKDGLKAGQAILIYGDGSKSLLIQEPLAKNWLLLKDSNDYIKNYIEGIENATETENKS